MILGDKIKGEIAWTFKEKLDNRLWATLWRSLNEQECIIIFGIVDDRLYWYLRGSFMGNLQGCIIDDIR